MYKRDKNYDGTILQGLIPEIPKPSSVKTTNQGSSRRKQDPEATEPATVRHAINPDILKMADVINGKFHLNTRR